MLVLSGKTFILQFSLLIHKLSFLIMTAPGLAAQKSLINVEGPPDGRKKMTHRKGMNV